MHADTEGQVQADPGASSLFAGADKKAIGGHGEPGYFSMDTCCFTIDVLENPVLAHASATRIMLRKGRGEERVAKIHDSVCLLHTCHLAVCFSTDLSTIFFPAQRSRRVGIEVNISRRTEELTRLSLCSESSYKIGAGGIEVRV